MPLLIAIIVMGACRWSGVEIQMPSNLCPILSNITRKSANVVALRCCLAAFVNEFLSTSHSAATRTAECLAISFRSDCPFPLQPTKAMFSLEFGFAASSPLGRMVKPEASADVCRKFLREK